MKSVEKQEIDKDYFLRKIRNPEGPSILIADFGAGRMELHVYRPRDFVIFVSPVVYHMSGREGEAFIKAVEDAADAAPDEMRRYQW
jgi:hypothetical protein